jgi:hypothetical protein
MITSPFYDGGDDIDKVSTTVATRIKTLSLDRAPDLREVCIWANAFLSNPLHMEDTMSQCDLSYAILSVHVYMTAICAGLHWHTRKMLLSISRSLSLRISSMPSEDILLRLSATRSLTREGVIHTLPLLLVKRAVELTFCWDGNMHRWGDVPIMDMFASSFDFEKSQAGNWAQFWFGAMRDTGTQRLIDGEWKSHALDAIGEDWHSFKTSVIDEDMHKIGQRKGVGGAFVSMVLDKINTGDFLHCETFDFACVNACRKITADRVSRSLVIPLDAKGSPSKLTVVAKSTSRMSHPPHATALCSLYLPSDLVSKVLSFVLVNEVNSRERFVDFLYVTNSFALGFTRTNHGVSIPPRVGDKRKHTQSNASKPVISFGRAACLRAISRMDFFVCDRTGLLPQKNSASERPNSRGTQGSAQADTGTTCALLWPRYFNETTTHTPKEITSLHPCKMLPVSIRVCELARVVFGTSTPYAGTLEVVIDTDALTDNMTKTAQIRQGLFDMISTVKVMTLYAKTDFKRRTGHIVEILSGAVNVRELRLAGPLSNQLAACSMIPSSRVRRILMSRGGQFSSWNIPWYAFMSIASCFRLVETIKFALETKNDMDMDMDDDIWFNDDIINPLVVRVVPTDKFEVFPKLVDVIVLDAKCNYAPTFKHSSGVQSHYPRLGIVPYSDDARRAG